MYGLITSIRGSGPLDTGTEASQIKLYLTFLPPSPLVFSHRRMALQGRPARVSGGKRTTGGCGSEQRAMLNAALQKQLRYNVAVQHEA